MSFAFGLAILGGAVAVGVRAYIGATATEQREVMTRIALESAAADLLGRYSAGEAQPLRPTTLPMFEINGRSVSVEASLPEGKRDLNGDAPRPVQAALAPFGPQDGAAPATIRASSLVELSRRMRLSADREDCLRRVITAGRAPEEFRPEASASTGAQEEVVRVAATGDQTDLRVAVDGPAGRTVLWTRARFSGQAGGGWALHDYRVLRFSTREACPES